MFFINSDSGGFNLPPPVSLPGISMPPPTSYAQSASLFSQFIIIVTTFSLCSLALFLIGAVVKLACLGALVAAFATTRLCAQIQRNHKKRNETKKRKKKKK
jgi:hypothetical protein